METGTGGALITRARRIDLERNARILSQVLDLAESLPYRPTRRLGYPPLGER